MSLPIDRTSKSALDGNLVNGNTSDAPVIKNSNDVVYNTIDELNNKVDSLVTSGTLSPIPPDFMQRQALVNGNFDVWQRGTTFSQPNTIYTSDRFKIANAVDNNVKVLRSTVVPNASSKYSLRAEVMTAASGVNAVSDFYQYVEDYNFFAGKQITISGYAICDSGASFYPRIEDGVSVLNGSTISSTTWTKFSFTVTVSNSATQLALALRFNRSGLAIGVGINFSQIQITTGNVALPFQPRSIGEEENLALRYNIRFSSSNPFTIFGSGQAVSATQAIIFIPFSRRMRIVGPTLTTGGNLALTNSTAGNILVTGVSVNTNGSRSDGVILTVTTAGGLTAGNAVIFQGNNDVSAYLNFDAEI